MFGVEDLGGLWFRVGVEGLVALSGLFCGYSNLMNNSFRAERGRVVEEFGSSIAQSSWALGFGNVRFAGFLGCLGRA